MKLIRNEAMPKKAGIATDTPQEIATGIHVDSVIAKKAGVATDVPQEIIVSAVSTTMALAWKCSLSVVSSSSEFLEQQIAHLHQMLMAHSR